MLWRGKMQRLNGWKRLFIVDVGCNERHGCRRVELWGYPRFVDTIHKVCGKAITKINMEKGKNPHLKLFVEG
jgi:hypothetical protein